MRFIFLCLRTYQSVYHLLFRESFHNLPVGAYADDYSIVALAEVLRDFPVIAIVVHHKHTRIILLFSAVKHQFINKVYVVLFLLCENISD